MSEQQCLGCGKSKAVLQCGICSSHICKYCAVFLEEDRVSFLVQIPDQLKHGTYCCYCYDQSVLPVLSEYDSLLERARHIAVYNKTQGKETRLVKRTEKPLSVSNCKDHDETIMRLAFFAAQANFNALVDVTVQSKKVKNNGYQTTIWSATGVPAQVFEHRVVKDRSIWQNPN